MKTSILILAVLLVQGVLSNTLGKKTGGDINDNLNDVTFGGERIVGETYDDLDVGKIGERGYIGGERTMNFDNNEKMVGGRLVGGVGRNLYNNDDGQFGGGRLLGVGGGRTTNFNDDVKIGGERLVGVGGGRTTNFNDDGKIGGGRFVGGGGRTMNFDDEGNYRGGKTMNFDNVGKIGGDRRNVRSLDGLNRVMNNFNDDVDFTNEGKTFGYNGKLGGGTVGMKTFNDVYDLGRTKWWQLQDTQDDDVLTKLVGGNRNIRSINDEEDTYTVTGGKMLYDTNDNFNGKYVGGYGGQGMQGYGVGGGRLGGGGRLVGGGRLGGGGGKTGCGGRTNGLNNFDMVKNFEGGRTTYFNNDMNDDTNTRCIINCGK